MKPNLESYDDYRKNFQWSRVEKELECQPGGGVNIAYEAITRHQNHPKIAEQIAMIWLSKNGDEQRLSYRDLEKLSNRFANGLKNLGVKPGDVVFGLSSRVPQLYYGALGVLKLQAVFSPLFSAFGPEPIRSRMEIGKGKVLLTNEALYKRKVRNIRDTLPDLEHIIILDDCSEDIKSEPGVHPLVDIMESSDIFEVEETSPDTTALIHFTSGTTGKPKGAVHSHRAVFMHYHSGRLALDLHPGDVFWCTADPGWVTGTSYGIISPLVNATTLIIDEGEFDAERWYQILQTHRVNVWYTAPTAVRMMMKLGEERLKKFDTSSLRFISSVGEPLNPEAVRWGEKAFGIPIHDNWWQSETGGIMIANYRSMKIKPGSMGKPIPGIDAKILNRENGEIKEAKTGEEGELALRTGWPSMFRAYLGSPEKYDASFVDGWYFSGDLAKQDEDGYFWFIGRADDVIKSAGHLIGPFEVESALIEHEAVAEAAVIGKPDDLLGHVVKAFVTLKPEFKSSPELQTSLIGHARKRLGPAVAPREIAIVKDLPKTRSGKIMRRLLKARELGLEEGDLSTLEDPNYDKEN